LILTKYSSPRSMEHYTRLFEIVTRTSARISGTT